MLGKQAVAVPPSAEEGCAQEGRAVPGLHLGKTQCRTQNAWRCKATDMHQLK